MKIIIYDNEPQKETILVSADTIYFQKYFPSLCFSISKLKNKNLHLHIINPRENDFQDYEKLKHQFHSQSDSFCSMSYEKTKIENFKQNIKTYYACNRFLIIKDFNIKKCLIVDIDSIFLNNFEYPKEDIGLFFREEFKDNFKLNISAGIFYFSEEAKDFIDYNYAILSTINKSGWWWFMDQFSLFMAYERYKDKLNFYTFNKNFMNFDNTTELIMYSAKGTNKESEDYKKLMQKYSF